MQCLKTKHLINVQTDDKHVENQQATGISADTKWVDATAWVSGSDQWSVSGIRSHAVDFPVLLNSNAVLILEFIINFFVGDECNSSDIYS